MPSDPFPEEQQDAEWRQLRAANVRRLLLLTALVALGIAGWLFWIRTTQAT